MNDNFFHPEPDESLRGGYMLFFVDDGEGMDPSKLEATMFKLLYDHNSLSCFSLSDYCVKHTDNSVQYFSLWGKTLNILFFKNIFRWNSRYHYIWKIHQEVLRWVPYWNVWEWIEIVSLGRIIILFRSTKFRCLNIYRKTLIWLIHLYL